MRPRFWIRWTIRDLRARWLQVAVIALIIAVGTGVYAGLGSTARWRRVSNDASYRRVRMHDLRVELGEGNLIPEGVFLRAVAPIDGIEVAQERLIAPVQVDASVSSRTILVPGQLISFDPERRAPVDETFLTRGERLDGADDRVLLEAHFADHYGLADSGSIRIGGGAQIDYAGVALTPEFFMVTTEEGGMMAEANFAALFASIDTVQHVTGFEGMVNDLVLRVSKGADLSRVEGAVEERLHGAIPGVAVDVRRAHDDVVHRILYDDIENDQKFWTVFALLILAGAVFAAFNLTSRMVESQRRQIGIGMAIGVRPPVLALRPLLVALEISLLGVLFGIGIGLLVGAGLRSLFAEMLPMPVWLTPFQFDMYARAAALGLFLPFVAAAWPVWRAVRVPPVEAIRTSHLAAKSGLARIVKRLPLPRRTTAQMPLSNLARAPRRTVLTALGVGAAITALVATFGMLDSFIDTIDRGEREQLRSVPDRMTAELSGFLPRTSPDVESISDAAGVERAEPTLRVPGRMLGDEPIDLRLTLLDLDGSMWSPTIVDGALGDGDGIILSEEAAGDAGVEVGDAVMLEVPRLTDMSTVTTITTPVRVLGLHPNPLRADAYMDESQVGLMGLAGLTNLIQIDPVGDQVDVRRALFENPAVVSVQSVAAMADLFRDLVREYVDILRFLQIFVLGLALLIAFNATSINLDERARENATMFAFGMPLRTVVRMTTVEGLLVGILGTAAGVGAGFAIVGWMVGVLVEDTMPELGMEVTLTAGTIVTAFVLGILSVGIAPLLSIPKLRRMDIPSTLRVVE